MKTIDGNIHDQSIQYVVKGSVKWRMLLKDFPLGKLSTTTSAMGVWERAEGIRFIEKSPMRRA